MSLLNEIYSFQNYVKLCMNGKIKLSIVRIYLMKHYKLPNQLFCYLCNISMYFKNFAIPFRVYLKIQ